jgi:transposase-like protein
VADEPSPEPEAIERWTAQRKAAIILEVLKGQISVPEAARKYGFTQNEYRRGPTNTIAPASMRSRPTARIRTRSTRPRSSGCVRRAVSS